VFSLCPVVGGIAIIGGLISPKELCDELLERGKRLLEVQSSQKIIIIFRSVANL
jgi:hypothetical protein